MIKYEKNILKLLKKRQIKHTILEKFEDLQDQKIIKNFEKEEKAGNVNFISGDDILKEIN
ncbi:hypothetical protein GMMP15_1370032 [Candidatus Magnetomoraceae bacterium gMMP-15]